MLLRGAAGVATALEWAMLPRTALALVELTVATAAGVFPSTIRRVCVTCQSLTHGAMKLHMKDQPAVLLYPT